MIFDALAFPSFFYTLDPAKGPLESAGSLFELPNASRSAANLSLYRTLKQTGWTKCKAGFDVYVREVPAVQTGLGEGGYLVFPGLRIRGSTRASTKMDGVQAVVDKGYIVRHIEAALAAYQSVADRFDQITRQNIHEIKGINSGIYHASVNLEKKLNSVFQKNEWSLAANISALSQILTARTDYMTFLAEDGLESAEYEPIPVYKKFDKMQLCFAARAEKSNVGVSMSGGSFSKTYGPKYLLDVAAYILIDNAVKYSPPGENVRVEVFDRDDHIIAQVHSIGPKLLDEEQKAIFDKDYRSGAAVRSGVTGTGLGLHALKSVIAPAFGGTVSVNVFADKSELNGVPFQEICFALTLPKFE